MKETYTVSMKTENAAWASLCVDSHWQIIKTYLQIDQTKVSSVAFATECDNLDENDLKSVAVSLEKSDHGFVW
jgi:hypothetical protein